MASDTRVTLIASGSAQLSFFLSGRTLNHIDFVVEVQNEWLTAASPASSYINATPAMLFFDMAAQLRGGAAIRSWEDIEGRVRLSASPALNGSVKLEVVITGPKFIDQAQVTLVFEASRLGPISREVMGLFA